MAHVGRRWKLHTRRDLCLQISTNQNANPEAWLCNVVVTQESPPVRIFDVFEVLTPPASEPWDSILRWRSAPTTYAGRTCIIEMLQTLEMDDLGFLKIGCRLLDSDENLVAEWRQYRLSEVQCSVGTLGVEHPTTWDADFWGTEFALIVSGCKPARWNVYP